MVSNSKLYRSLKVVSVFIIASVVAGMQAGCGSSASMSCKYQQGDIQKIRYAGSTENRIWVEKADGQRQQTGQNMSRNEMIVSRQVESVASDGSAIMKVTFEQVEIAFESNVGKKSKQGAYKSTAESTTSSNPGEPALAGTSYKIRIAPDTTVLEIIGLDQLRKDLGISGNDELRVARLLSEENIRLCHECDFAKGCGRTGITAGRISNHDKRDE